VTEEQRPLIIQTIAWLIMWEQYEEAEALQSLLFEYEMLKLEMKNAPKNR